MTANTRDDRTIRLTDDVRIPSVGFGTYLISNADAPEAVAAAVGDGYRHVDTVEVYGNEEDVGAALQSSLAADGLSRDEIFVTTKLWPGNAAWGHTPNRSSFTRGPKSRTSCPISPTMGSR